MKFPILEFTDWLKDIGVYFDTLIFRPYDLSISNRMPWPKSNYKYRKFKKAGFIKEHKNTKDNFDIAPNTLKLLNKYKQTARVDGLKTIVIFDIPERKRRHRTVFRRHLLDRNFTCLQKSVFTSPYELTPDIFELATTLNIQRYIRVISGKLEN